MSDWMNWLIVAGIIVALELFTGTFYLLMIAFGMFAGALAAFLGWTIEFQIITAASVGVIATIALRRSRFGIASKIEATRNPNVNIDIGQSVQIHEWQMASPNLYRARVMYRGAFWDVEYRGAETPQQAQQVPQAGMYKIVEVRGNQLIVDRL